MIRRLMTAALAVAAMGAIQSAAAEVAKKDLAPTKGEAGTVVDGDVLFGYQSVGLISDRDAIPVGAEIGKFDRIRFRILDNDIFINDIKVVYVDGSSTDVAIAEEIKQNTRTKWFAIKGDKFIKEIQLSYRSKAKTAKGNARFEVFGDYAAGWLGKNGEGRKYNQGWVLLGADVAGFVGFETRTFSVGRNEGDFRNIRVTARNRDITLKGVTIVYAGGQSDAVNMYEKVQMDKSYGPIDLKGKVAAIKEIRATYRSRFFSSGKGNAKVEIWGQH